MAWSDDRRRLAQLAVIPDCGVQRMDGRNGRRKSLMKYTTMNTYNTNRVYPRTQHLRGVIQKITASRASCHLQA